LHGGWAEDVAVRATLAGQADRLSERQFGSQKKRILKIEYQLSVPSNFWLSGFQIPNLFLKFSHLLLAVFFIVAGVCHFAFPAPYLAIMPPFLPCPDGLVWISGIAEIAGGVGVLSGTTRRIAGCGLIALLIAVFPANIYAVFAGMKINGWTVPAWLLWLRLPFQPALILWVWRSANFQRR
jgi:uncharacterized membrane protein